jgi:isoleucyl-tRNA synthetase
MGKTLEGEKYDFPLKDIIPKQVELETKHPLVHHVIGEDFVDIDTATGVVHLSPGNGEEDFWAAQRRGVPIFAPFDDEVKFTKDSGLFNGVFARDADYQVVEELRNRNAFVDVKKTKHEYPTCWRSHHKLVWLARKEYFLRTDKINDKVLEAAEKIEYFFDEPKNRFIAFLKEGKPWCISRERIWGTPLPIWACENCGEKKVLGSKAELMENALEKIPETFELHKPWVDRVTFRCPKCGGVMRREDYVLDTWHNSGASPYARWDTDEEFRKFVPTDFLTEGIDQTRGWANSLLLEYVILTGKPEGPYKAFLFQGLTQDARGRKMSKSLGNVVETNKLLEKNSADLCRFYMMRKCSPIDFMNFDLQELNRRSYQVLSTLYHLSRFFLQNAEFDEFDARQYIDWNVILGTLQAPDRWLLSKLQSAITVYTEKLGKCEFNMALAILENFVIETLSRLYVPMIRKELWTDDPETLKRRMDVYAVLHYALKTVTLLFNPVTPYLSEALYQKVYRRLDPNLPTSINFDAWPEPAETLCNNIVEEEFDLLFKAASLVYAARQQAKLKRRWPLSTVIVVATEKIVCALKNVEAMFLELSNVKTVEYMPKSPNLPEDENWVSTVEGDLTIIVSAKRDENLLGEGIMRDLARRVQALRKELGYVPTDILDGVHISELDKESIGLVESYLAEMAELVRARKVSLHEKREEVSDADWHETELDGKKVFINIH